MVAETCESGLIRQKSTRLSDNEMDPAVNIISAYSITINRSPSITVAPFWTWIGFDNTAAFGIDVVLHLHRLEHEKSLTGSDACRPPSH